jgi:hypothetical protein
MIVIAITTEYIYATCTNLDDFPGTPNPKVYRGRHNSEGKASKGAHVLRAADSLFTAAPNPASICAATSIFTEAQASYLWRPGVD